MTQQQLNYVDGDLHNRGTNEQHLADAVFTGPFGHLPAGIVDWALGGQYRQETGKLALDPNNLLGVSGGFGTTQLPSETSFHTEEVFAETRVPLLAGLPAARAVEATLGARYSHSSAFRSTTTYQGGVRWSMAKVVSVRGGYAQVYRAPTTLNLYATQSVEFAFIDDPCGEGPSPAQQVNCAAHGVPGGSYAQKQPALAQTTVGGNPRLVPEQGDTWTAGVLLQLPWLEGLRATLDYYRAELHNAIETPDVETVPNQCANSGQQRLPPEQPRGGRFGYSGGYPVCEPQRPHYRRYRALRTGHGEPVPVGNTVGQPWSKLHRRLSQHQLRRRREHTTCGNH